MTAAILPPTDQPLHHGHRIFHRPGKAITMRDSSGFKIMDETCVTG
jgi:hypothetical protein